MIVYVVTQGDYSDYHICGVALSKERAEQLVKINMSYYAVPQIEEYDTDETDSALARLVPIYLVQIYNDGRCDVEIDEYIDDNEPYDSKFEFYPKDNYFCAFLKAKDTKHVVKIAQDERAKRVVEAMDL